MKVCILTHSSNTQDGWGRYTHDLNEALVLAGVETSLVTLPDPLNYRLNFLLAPYYAWKIRREVRKCDVVHVFLEPYAYVAYWLLKLTRKRYFVTVHGTFGVLPYYLGGYHRYCHNKALKNAEKIICVSEYTKRRLGEYGLKNLISIHNGIDIRRFEEKTSQDKENYILSVGVLKPRKGYHLSIRAFAKVREKFPELKYYIVGDQSDKEYYALLMKAVSQLGIIDHVKFISNVSDEEIAKIYSSAKLFLLTPISEGAGFEGFGLVYLEAGAQGLPVIGTYDSGAEDAIRDNVTGMIVPQTVDDVAQALERLLSRSSASQAMGRAGREWAEAHDWSLVAREYIKIYG